MVVKEIVDPITEAIRMGEDGTLNPLTGDRPKDGYMVGGGSWTLVVSRSEFKPEMVELFVKAHESDLLSIKFSGRFYIGWWTYNGKVYIDPAEQWGDIALATQFARSMKEIAIWDVKNSQEIIV